MTDYQSKQYKKVYDIFISKWYDIGLKIGLTPAGENILRTSVFKSLSPYIKKSDRILDLCCGTGTLTILLTRLLYKDCKIIGVDLSSGQIAKAQKKNRYPNLTFAIMDANDLKFSKDYFDHAVISAALHEMDKTQRLNVLSEIHRVIKKEGIFLIFEHHEPSKILLRILYNFYLGFIENITSHSSEMQRSILKELKKTNFRILKQTPIKNFLSFFQIILSKK
ncbi:MAG: methyltransferase domain-containing protein [Candidatus Lokiarchaeota archaeon]|nr:methyltransferase domain-containing protein [Candidatus Lokiarchaeota archaeon]